MGFENAYETKNVIFFAYPVVSASILRVICHVL